MPQSAWSAKRERQYEHIKESEKKQGRSTKRAKEIAARTVNKARARSGESKTRSRTSTRDMSSGRRGGLHSGALEHDQSAAAARSRPAQVGVDIGRGRAATLGSMQPKTLDHVAFWVAD